MSAYEGRSIFDLPSIFSYYLISSSLKRKKKKKLFQSFNDLIVNGFLLHGISGLLFKRALLHISPIPKEVAS